MSMQKARTTVRGFTMECAKLATCPFFNDKMASAPATAALLKEMYCRGDFVKCARFIVSAKLGAPGVPSDLFPHQIERAKLLLGGWSPSAL